MPAWWSRFSAPWRGPSPSNSGRGRGEFSAPLAPVAPAGSGPSREIARDHDANRLHPARHVEDARQAALDQHAVVLRPGPWAGLRIPGRLLDTEELEALVVLLVTARHRREVAAAAAPRAVSTAVTAFARSAGGRLSPLGGRTAATGPGSVPVGSPPAPPAASLLAAGLATSVCGFTATGPGRSRPLVCRHAGPTAVAGWQRLVVMLVVGCLGSLDAVTPSGLVGGPCAAASPATAAAATTASPGTLAGLSSRLLGLAPQRRGAGFIAAVSQRLVGGIVAEVAARRAVVVAEV